MARRFKTPRLKLDVNKPTEILEPAPPLAIQAQARARAIRRAAIIGIAAMLLLGLTAVAWAAIRVNTSHRSALARVESDKDLSRSLREGSRVDPARTLVAVVRRTSATSATVDLALVRHIPTPKKAWVLAVPRTLRFPTASGDRLFPGEIWAQEGRAGLVDAVVRGLDLSVAHYVELDAGDLVHAGERAGVAGIAVALGDAEPVDTSGQPLTGERAALERWGGIAATFAEFGEEVGGVFDLSRAADLLGELGRNGATDFGFGELRAFLATFEGAARSGLNLGVIAANGEGSRPDADELARLLKQFKEAQPFVETKPPIERVVPARVRVQVLNGAGVDGVASEAANLLKKLGYRVGEVSNANQFVYDETLVVYRDDSLAAHRIVRELPAGKVVPSRGMYAFEGDILVVVGRDWRPLTE